MGDISIDLIISGIFIIFAVCNFIGGFGRGIIRQILQTVCSVVAAVIAYAVTEGALETFVSSVDGQTLNDYLLGFVEEGSALANFIPYMTFAEWLLVLPAATVLAPVILTALFVVINLVLKIACAIVGIILPKNVLGLGGALLGAVEGVLIATVILFPAISIVDMAEDTVDVLRDNDDGSYTEIIESYDSLADQITDNAFFGFVNDLVCRDMVDSFATITVDGKETNLVYELDTVVLILLDMSGIENNDYVELSEEQKEILLSAADSIEESPYLTSLIASMFSDLGHAAENNAFPVEIGDSYETLIHSMFHVFATSSKDNLHTDIDTLLEVYFILCDSGSLKAYGTQGGEEEMKAGLLETDADGVNVITKVVDKLNENEHMKPVVTAITEMTIKMLAGQLGLDYDTLEAYNDIKDGLNNVLAMDKSAEGYEEARDAEIDKVLTEQGVELDDTTVNEIGDYIDENFEDVEELTDEQINEIILYYFETSEHKE